jgi:nitrite reductase/ring-hydroxylating ferredoxin subunit
MQNWIDIGGAEELSAAPLKRITTMNREFAVSYKDGQFGVVSNTCNHAGGPLGKGRLDGEYIVCPWHNWKLSARGTIGNSTGVTRKVNLASRTIVFLLTQLRSRVAAS